LGAGRAAAADEEERHLGVGQAADQLVDEVLAPDGDGPLVGSGDVRLVRPHAASSIAPTAAAGSRGRPAARPGILWGAARLSNGAPAPAPPSARPLIGLYCTLDHACDAAHGGEPSGDDAAFHPAGWRSPRHCRKAPL